MKNSNKRKGINAEKTAEQFLVNVGYNVLARNYYSKHGEIDIIADDNGILAFIEVKFRKSSVFESPRQAVTIKKQRRIIKTAMHYLISADKEYGGVRFDVAEVFADSSVNIIKGAFTAHEV